MEWHVTCTSHNVLVTFISADGWQGGDNSNVDYFSFALPNINRAIDNILSDLYYTVNNLPF